MDITAHQGVPWFLVRCKSELEGWGATQKQIFSITYMDTCDSGQCDASLSSAKKVNVVFALQFCAAMPESLNWCVVSTEEIWKCGEMAVAFRKKNLKPAIQCISAKTKEECMELIQVGCCNPCAVNQMHRSCSLLGRWG